LKACILGAYTLLALVLQSLSCIAQSSTAVSDSSLLLVTDSLLADSLLKDSVFISEDLVILGDLSGAFTHNSNWRNQSFSSINISSKIEVLYKYTDEFWYKNHRLLLDFSVDKFVDSIWHKRTDEISAEWLWQHKDKHIETSYMLNVRSQLFPTYNYFVGEKEKTANFLTPLSIEFGYGKNWVFWGLSNLNISFATLKFINKPNCQNDFDVENQLFKLKNSKLDLQYGFSCQLNIDKQLNTYTLWRNASRFFLNGADKEHFTMDVVNSIQFEIIKNIKLSVNTSLEYDHNVSDKLQFSQMVLIGFLYEIKPKVM
jgi:hypothetical protein